MVDTEKTKLNRICVDDSFLMAIGHYFYEKQNNANYINFLTEKKFTAKDTDSTYRVINHWSSLGLFDDTRSGENKGWRKFSLIDRVWLQVLMELRKFGVSLEKIQHGYQAIKEKEAIFECGVALCLMQKSINLIVFSDGYMEVVPQNAIHFNESTGYFKETAYLIISLNSCLNHILPNKNLPPLLDTFELSSQEISILSELRSGLYDEVSIQMKNGAIEYINTKQKHSGNAISKLSDMLNKTAYGEFKIKKQDGKIIFVEKIKKEKL